MMFTGVPWAVSLSQMSLITPAKENFSTLYNKLPSYISVCFLIYLLKVPLSFNLALTTTSLSLTPHATFKEVIMIHYSLSLSKPQSFSSFE